jgi:WD40 repeat protein
MRKSILLIVIILFVSLWQIHTQTTNNQTKVSKTNFVHSKFVLRSEHEKDVEGVAFNPNSKWLASADNGGKIVLWNLKTQKQEYVFTGKNFSEVAFDPKGILMAAAGFDHKVYLWDVWSKKLLFELPHDAEIETIAFSRYSHLLASAGGDRVIKLWDSRTGREVYKFVGHEDSIYSVAFSPDGEKMASGSRDKTIRIWDVGSGRQLQVLSGNADSIYSVFLQLKRKTSCFRRSGRKR